jgi:(2Fe-2S) ferredoxin
MICVNMAGVNKPCCGKRGSVALAEAIERGVRDRRIALKAERIHCFNKCHVGPNMRIAPGGEFLEGVSDGEIPDILDRLETLAGRAVHKLVAGSGLIYPGG